MSKKLIPFARDSEFYLQKGIETAERGDLPKAVSLFFAAREKSEENTEALFRIADIYSDLELYDFSNSVLYEILLQEPDNKAAGLMLARNFGMTGDTFRELYYLDKFSSVGESEEFAGWLEEGVDAVSYKQVHPMTQSDRELNQYRVLQLCDRGMTLQAREVLKNILEYYPDDVFSLNHLSKISLIEEKYEEAVNLAQAALEKKPDDVFGLCNLSLALYLLGAEERAAQIADSLAAINPTDPEDLQRITRFFCFLGRHEDIVSWCRKCLKEMPYELDFLIFLGIACYNTRRLDEAKDAFLALHKLKVSPIIVRYFLETTDDAIEDGTNEILPYSFDLPPYLQEDNIKRLQTMDYSDIKDTEKSNLIHWGLRFTDNETAVMILDKIMEAGDGYKKTFERMLISDLPPKVKTQVLFRLFLAKKRRLYIVKDDYFSEVVCPNRMPPESVKRGFLLACAMLNCLLPEVTDAVRRLSRTAFDLADILSNRQYFAGAEQDNLIAAVLVRRTESELVNDKVICALFDIDYNILSAFIEHIYSDDI